MRMTATSVAAVTKPIAVVPAVAGALTMLFALPVQAQHPNPRVLPPNSAPDGLTYGEWSAKWVKWAFEPITAESPLADDTGANCAVGQSGRVWFLAGTSPVASPPTPVVRDCTIPSGRMLFFPVGNGFCAGDGFPDGFLGERRCATSFADDVRSFGAGVDPIP